MTHWGFEGPRGGSRGRPPDRVGGLGGVGRCSYGPGTGGTTSPRWTVASGPLTDTNGGEPLSVDSPDGVWPGYSPCGRTRPVRVVGVGRVFVRVTRPTTQTVSGVCPLPRDGPGRPSEVVDGLGADRCPRLRRRRRRDSRVPVTGGGFSDRPGPSDTVPSGVGRPGVRTARATGPVRRVGRAGRAVCHPPTPGPRPGPAGPDGHTGQRFGRPRRRPYSGLTRHGAGPTRHPVRHHPYAGGRIRGTTARRPTRVRRPPGPPRHCTRGPVGVRPVGPPDVPPGTSFTGRGSGGPGPVTVLQRGPTVVCREVVYRVLGRRLRTRRRCPGRGRGRRGGPGADVRTSFSVGVSGSVHRPPIRSHPPSGVDQATGRRGRSSGPVGRPTTSSTSPAGRSSTTDVPLTFPILRWRRLRCAGRDLRSDPMDVHGLDLTSWI